MHNISKLLLFVFFNLLVNACSESSKNTPLLPIPSKQEYINKVVYENFGSQGEFISSAVIEDPYAKNYNSFGKTRRTPHPFVTIGKGSPSKRVNIVIMGDGYSKDDQKKYQEQVDQVISQFLETPPMSSYKDLFLFHRIDIVSNKSGVNKNFIKTESTPLDMLSGCEGLERLLCINVDKAMAAAANAPKVDMVFAIANTSEYGGAGYRSPPIATFAGGSPQSFELALHEFGHSFANLADEYDYTGSDINSCLELANASSYSLSEIINSKLKWWRWVGDFGVNAYKGSCYNTDSYRPTFNSKMRNLGRPFEAINSEQIIAAIFNKASLIDANTPEGRYAAQGYLFIYKSLNSSGVQWSVNGKVVHSMADKGLINISELALQKSINTIEALVFENTDQVRNEQFQTQLMQKKLKWELIKLK